MAGGIRSKDIRKSWDDVTNDDKTKAYDAYVMNLIPEKSLVTEK